MNQQEAVETYQCPGCSNGSNFTCFVPGHSLACDEHAPGSLIIPIGVVFLGMPKGFDRLGIVKDFKMYIFPKYESGWDYCVFNIPVWKHLDEHGNTLVRGLSPRINAPFLHIFLENCMDKFDCLEITEAHLATMD